MNFRVNVAERDVVWKSEPQVTENQSVFPQPASKQLAPSRFGMTIMRLTQKERRDLSIDDKDGVKVVSIDPGSFADDIGVLEGDAILSINRHLVSSPDDVIRVQSTLKAGQAVAVHIVRGSGNGRRAQDPQRYYLSGRLPEN